MSALAVRDLEVRRGDRAILRGVSFDEAFRVAIGGAAQILSGNGQP